MFPQNARWQGHFFQLQLIFSIKALRYSDCYSITAFAVHVPPVVPFGLFPATIENDPLKAVSGTTRILGRHIPGSLWKSPVYFGIRRHTRKTGRFSKHDGILRPGHQCLYGNPQAQLPGMIRICGVICIMAVGSKRFESGAQG